MATSPTEGGTPAPRVRLSETREGVQVPAAALVELSERILHDARERGQEDLLADVQKVCDSSRRLVAMVEEFLDPGKAAPVTAEFAAQARHNLRTPLAEIIGLAEMWLEDAPEKLLEGFIDDLRRLRDLAKWLLATVDEVLAAGPPAPFAPNVDAGAEALPSVRDGIKRPRATGAILVIEDNEINRNLLTHRLSRDGHVVASAPDGRRGLMLARSQPFDLILLDLLMPEMDGFDVLTQLKADRHLREVPVIIISAFNDIDSIARGIEMGAADYLPKPCNAVLLRARVGVCLEQKRLRDREVLYLNQLEQAAVRARVQLEQFFTRELYQELEARPQLLQPRDAEITVLVCDIRGFSRISERLGPARTVEWISDVLTELSECVLGQRGVVVEYIGDELMAMWGAPAEVADHPARACAAALEMLVRLPALNRRWEPLLGEPTAIGIGVNTGMARVGNIGSRYKFKYGALGNTVNVASRVQGATKYLGTRLILTRSTHERLGAGFTARRLCRARVVNIAEPVDLYELSGNDTDGGELRRQYEQALALFEVGQIRTAIRMLGNLLNDYPDDGPSPILLSRAVSHLAQDRKCVDPVWELPGK
jgi:adenylate cyclase